MTKEKSKTFTPEIENALDDLCNKMNSIGLESSKHFLLQEKSLDSMKEEELRVNLKEVMSSLNIIESSNQEAAKIIRNRIISYLK